VTNTTPDHNWLSDFLDQAVEKNTCFGINCTTCAAGNLRDGLLDALKEARDGKVEENLMGRLPVTLAEDLAELKPPRDHTRKYNEAIRFIINDLSVMMGSDLKTVLEGSFAGDVYANMERHHRGVTEARRVYEEANDPEKVRQHREEKKQLKQQKHEERLARKKERDKHLT